MKQLSNSAGILPPEPDLQVAGKQIPISGNEFPFRHIYFPPNRPNFQILTLADI